MFVSYTIHACKLTPNVRFCRVSRVRHVASETTESIPSEIIACLVPAQRMRYLTLLGSDPGTQSGSPSRQCGHEFAV